jgi:hypothetical protein
MTIIVKLLIIEKNYVVIFNRNIAKENVKDNNFPYIFEYNTFALITRDSTAGIQWTNYNIYHLA